MAIQIVLMLGTLAVTGSAIAYHGGPQWLAPAALIAASVLGGLVHAEWAATDAPLPASVRSTFHLRTEALTLALSALILEVARALAPTLLPELVDTAASARLAFGIAAVFVIGHALITAPASLAERELAGDLDARIQIPRRPPRLRRGHAPARRTHDKRQLSGAMADRALKVRSNGALVRAFRRPPAAERGVRQQVFL